MTAPLIPIRLLSALLLFVLTLSAGVTTALPASTLSGTVRFDSATTDAARVIPASIAERAAIDLDEADACTGNRAEASPAPWPGARRGFPVSAERNPGGIETPIPERPPRV